MTTRLRFRLFFAAALAGVAAQAQVPTWPKTTPADITAAGVGVQITGADYGNGTFVLATYFGGTSAVPTTSPVVFTSPDGTTWTRRNLTGSTGRTGLPRFLNGKFFLGVTPLASNGGSGGNGVIFSSADGVTWAISAPLGATVNAPAEFAFGNGTYVAPLSSGGVQAATSTDGVRWSTRVIVAGGSAGHIAFFNGKFYANVFGSGTIAGLYSSADGITWGRVTGAPANPGILAANATTLLVTFFNNGVSGQSVSSDGVTFTTASPGIALQTETIKVLNDAFVVTASPSATVFDLNLARASLDGRTWATIGSTANKFYAPEVAYGNGRYVFVGEFDVYAGSTTITAGGSAGGGGGTGGGGTGGATVAQFAGTYSGKIGSRVNGSVNDTLTDYTVTISNTGTVTVTIGGISGSLVGTINLSGLITFTSGNGLALYNLTTATILNGLLSSDYNAVLGTSGAQYRFGISGGTGAGVAAPVTFLGNLSVRARAGSGAETLIVGVTVGGGTTGTKSVLIRGIGPTLATFGVTGALADPVLSVFQGGTSIISNDDWGSDATIATTSAAVGAFALPAGSRDSAIAGSGIGAGSYTVQLTGKAGATGNGLIELYDTTPAAGITATSPRFTNLSARTFGGTGSDTLIVGFNISGTESRRLVIRAVGPGLAAFGVAGTMADPKLELYSGATKVGENDNWDAATLAAQQSVGAFALTANSRDAVLVSTLQPGSYTVQVTGGTTGVALVEVYEAP